MSLTLALSSGEPAGIGPDICLMLARRALPCGLLVLADPDVLEERSRQLRLEVELDVLGRGGTLGAAEPGDATSLAEPVIPTGVASLGAASLGGVHRPGRLAVWPIPANAPVVPGKLDTANAAYVLEILRRGTALCTSGACAALVTAPVQKSVIARSGVPFSGHTEFLAELTGAALPVMLLAGPELRVALATTHLPLRAVPDAVTADLIERTVAVIHRDFAARFGIPKPRIMVLGLNPHAGEQGTLGLEEQEVLGPAVQRLAARGFAAFGPVSADTAFTPESLARCDVVLAMYHDQGLPVLKASAFGEVVNVTLGLPIIRTSVDHGTALELAGTGRARHDSLAAAVELAHALARRAASPAS